MFKYYKKSKVKSHFYLPIGGSVDVCGVVLQGNSQEDPRPWRRKILKDSDANLSGIEAIHNVPNEDTSKDKLRWWQFSFQTVTVRSKKGRVKQIQWRNTEKLTNVFIEKKSNNKNSFNTFLLVTKVTKSNLVVKTG